jgi:hypothetical protein
VKVTKELNVCIGYLIAMFPVQIQTAKVEGSEATQNIDKLCFRLVLSVAILFRLCSINR